MSIPIPKKLSFGQTTAGGSVYTSPPETTTYVKKVIINNDTDNIISSIDVLIRDSGGEEIYLLRKGYLPSGWNKTFENLILNPGDQVLVSVGDLDYSVHGSQVGDTVVYETYKREAVLTWNYNNSVVSGVGYKKWYADRTWNLKKAIVTTGLNQSGDIEFDLIVDDVSLDTVVVSGGSSFAEKTLSGYFNSGDFMKVNINSGSGYDIILSVYLEEV